jgi:TonB family protein
MSAMRIGVLLCCLVAGAMASPGPDALHGAVRSDAAGPVVASERATDPDVSTPTIPVIPFLAIEIRPQPVSVPDAEYPLAARKAHKEGLVVVEALVDLDGWVSYARILRPSGSGLLDQAAMAAIREAKFQPANSRDGPMQKWVTMPYRFVLTSGKGTAQVKSVSLVATEGKAPRSDFHTYNDSVLKPLHSLHFVHLKPIAPRGAAHGRLLPDSAAIRFNNEAMTAASAAFEARQGDSLSRPASYYLQSDWCYLVIDSGRCRVFRPNHLNYASSHAEVYNVDKLAVRPVSLDTGYVEAPTWTALPQYVPLKLEFDVGHVRRTIHAPTFGLEVH